MKSFTVDQQVLYNKLDKAMHMIVNGKLTWKSIIKKLKGHCDKCNRKSCPGIEWRGCGTAYNKLVDNFNCVCKECFDSEEDYWQELWTEYYSGLL